MDSQKFTLKKQAMLEALEASMGVVSTACQLVEISRRTHYDWLAKDEAYKKAVAEIENVALDFAESKLFKNIEKAKEASIFFYLKTKGKKRGYIERQEIKMDGSIESKVIEWTPAKEE